MYHTLLSHTADLEKLDSRLDVNGLHTSSASSSQPSVYTRLPVSLTRDELPTAFPLDRGRHEGLAKDFPRLIALFDDILVEEYCRDHASMPCLASYGTMDEEDCIACDFCGADVFQSFFECQDCGNASTSDESTRDSHKKARWGDGLIICPPCYVEGRSCRCEAMTAVQCRPFDVLLHARRRAMRVLAGLRQDHSLGHLRDLPDEEFVFSR